MKHIGVTPSVKSWVRLIYIYFTSFVLCIVIFFLYIKCNVDLNNLTFAFTKLNLDLPSVTPSMYAWKCFQFQHHFFHLENEKILIVISSLFFIPCYEFHFTTSLFITFLHLTGLINSFDTYCPFLPFQSLPQEWCPSILHARGVLREYRSDSSLTQQGGFSLLFQLSDEKNPSSFCLKHRLLTAD